MHILSPNEAGGVEVEDVTQTTLDEWWSGEIYPKIDFIKIDTDGGEADVIEGANKSLNSMNPKLFCEVNVLHNAAKRIYFALESIRYTIRAWPEMAIVGSAEELEQITAQRWAANSAEGMNIFAEVL
jgi:hypothetical protein